MSPGRRVLLFLLLGPVPLSADTVYEGGRLASRTYLAEVGAPATIPALIGVGKFLGLAFI